MGYLTFCLSATEALSGIRMQRNAASVERWHAKKKLLQFILSSVEHRDHFFLFHVVLAEPGQVLELCVPVLPGTGTAAELWNSSCSKSDRLS